MLTGDYVALSPQGIGTRFAKGAWRDIHKPVLMMTGTKDREVLGDYKNRLTAFEGLPTGGKRLAVLRGGSHRNMGGRGRGAGPGIVRAVLLEYLEGIRSGDPMPAKSRPGVSITDK